MTAILALGALMFALASLLVLAHRKLAIAEDPRIEATLELLPHANCGACGYPGCRPFAEALVQGAARPAACTVGSASDHTRIAALLGVEVGAQEKVVARLACAGGDHVARRRAHYVGWPSCNAAALVSGGGKSCFWGCLGFGDCADACDFDAIQMDAHGLPRVVEAHCTACGDCVRACPKDLFSLHPVGHRLFVACASSAAGEEILDDCRVACTACGRCAVDAPDHIVMRDGLPRIEYSRPGAPRSAIERCPTGAIGWFGEARGFEVGAAARSILRHSPRPDAAT